MKTVFEARMQRGAFGLFLAFVLVAGALGLESADRHPDAMEFPKLGAKTDDGDVLDDYPAYLKFVLDVGKDMDRASSQRLEHTYAQLRSKDPAGAARFLRGLRFEMVQKLEMIGLSPEQASTANPTMRKWVVRYMPAWYREADEYLFRAKSQVVRK